jgi:phosphohistidine phosphatase
MTTRTSPNTCALGLISLTHVSEPQRTLLLMRHAKSAYPPNVADHDRPLAPRGIREAGLAGDWLRAHTPSIDAVLCSTATRTRQTLAQTGIDTSVRYSERLYGATPGMMIDEINDVADTVSTLLVVGHEPTMSSLSIGLAGPDGTDDTAVQRIAEKFPTSAIAVLSVAGDWRSVELGHAALIEFHVPR